MTETLDETIFRLNKDNANQFANRCTSSDTKEHDIASISDIDCAGLQVLCSLAKNGHKFLRIKPEIEEKLELTGALELVKK